MTFMVEFSHSISPPCLAWCPYFFCSWRRYSVFNFVTWPHETTWLKGHVTLRMGAPSDMSLLWQVWWLRILWLCKVNVFHLTRDLTWPHDWGIFTLREALWGSSSLFVTTLSCEVAIGVVIVERVFTFSCDFAIPFDERVVWLDG